MEFFDPQVSIHKKPFMEGNKYSFQYFLHIITYTDNAAYDADGITVDDSQADASILGADIGISLNTAKPMFFCSHQVSHIVALGAVPFGEEITVNLTWTTKNKGKKKTKTKSVQTRPLNMSRPDDAYTVEAVWEAIFGTSKKE